MRSQPEKQIIAIHILPNISRSKGNRTLGQLIEYNMKNNRFVSGASRTRPKLNWMKHEKHFLQKSFTKCFGETIHRTFSEKSKLSIFFDQ